MIKQIRKKCIEANPEIVELKFGCEIEIPKLNNFTFKGIIFKLKLSKTPHYVGVAYGSMYRESENFSHEREIHFDDLVEKKIIGRPIRLADVLFTVAQKAPPLFSQQVIMEAEEPRKILGMWNLKDDNLEHQSKETIEFIHSFLCV